MYCRKLSRCRSGSGPHGIVSASLSSVTSSEACSKWLGRASSWESWPGTRVLGQSSKAVLRAAAVADQPALPELAQHLDGLLQHLQAGVDPRPAVAEDVLVEVLAGADPEQEPALEHEGGGGRRLGQDGRVDPGRR